MTAAEFPAAVSYVLVIAVLLALACRGLWHALTTAWTLLWPGRTASPCDQARIRAAATAEDAAVERARDLLENA